MQCGSNFAAANNATSQMEKRNESKRASAPGHFIIRQRGTARGEVQQVRRRPDATEPLQFPLLQCNRHLKLLQSGAFRFGRVGNVTRKGVRT